ncbi:unnamed protein product [Nezara viridula]|uniref:Uncharacterized protein n=1 Tax=Nezara viridula TaxID=85310 RepID=A0A9P0H518_NEZVI|nr:unnamed protein product [Nezara viridula]
MMVCKNYTKGLNTAHRRLRDMNSSERSMVPLREKEMVVLLMLRKPERR